MNTNQIQNQLEEYYRRTFPIHQDVQISDVTALTEKWESIIYAFKVAADPHNYGLLCKVPKSQRNLSNL